MMRKAFQYNNEVHGNFTKWNLGGEYFYGWYLCMYVFNDRKETGCPKRKQNMDKFSGLEILYRWDCAWQTVPVLNDPTCKTVSSLGSPGFMKGSK